MPAAAGTATANTNNHGVTQLLHRPTDEFYSAREAHTSGQRCGLVQSPHARPTVWPSAKSSAAVKMPMPALPPFGNQQRTLSQPG
jgi:hypothetical protein